VLNFIGGAIFANGRSQYLDHDADATEGSAKIFVQIAPEGFDGPVLAQLDTGAAWSVLNREIADELGLLGGDGEVMTISTRNGNYTGRLEEATITILAQEGESLEVNARVFVSNDWPGRTFLGYSGLLERIRFGLDPQSNHFYFGGY
jgi:predicted aspartyl protease